MKKFAVSLIFVVFVAVAAKQLLAQTLLYNVRLEAQPGTLLVTFSTADAEAHIYLPDDLKPGDEFSGTVEASRNFELEFAGETTETRDGAFRGTVPQAVPDGLLPMVLRDRKGTELARAVIRLPAAKKSETARTSVRMPRLIQAGGTFPILGPFDGDLGSTELAIAGAPVKILAESPRNAVGLAPETLVGPAEYRLTVKGASFEGQVRSLAVRLTKSNPAPGAGSPAASSSPSSSPSFDLTVKGLAGVDRDVPIKIGAGYFYLRADQLPESGNFSVSRYFEGVKGDQPGEAANLVIPETPEEEVVVVLRTPQREAGRDNVNALGEEHAGGLRALDFDTLPVAAQFLTDPELGSDAAYAMLALDEHRALTLLFGSLPASGPNMERLTLVWFLDHSDFRQESGNAKEARAAALRLLDHAANSGTVNTDLALYVLGLTGGRQDLALLEAYYDNKDRWAGQKSTRDASQAALARLGSATHLEALRAELAAPLPPKATLPQGERLVQALDKAGYTGSRELAPEVCGHISDPDVIEIDIGTDPGRHALRALSSIVDGTNPRNSQSRRTPEAWREWCAANAVR